MAFDGTTAAALYDPSPATQVQQPPCRPATRRPSLAVDRLPFVGQDADGNMAYWRVERLPDGQNHRTMGRTFAAWYLVYAELNGAQAGRWLMDRIEREMPSRYPELDRAFLDGVFQRG